MALADVVHEAQEPSAKTYTTQNFVYFGERLTALGEQCKVELQKQGFSNDSILLEPYLHMRYDGTDCALMCTVENSGKPPTYQDFLDTFLKRYKSEFGFVIPQRDIIVDDIRVRGVGKSFLESESPKQNSKQPPKARETAKVYFDSGYQDTGVFLLKELFPGDVIPGPAIIMDELSTILVEPDCTASITKNGDTKITIGKGEIRRIGPELDSIQLSIFSHRFMSIAEQMGR